MRLAPALAAVLLVATSATTPSYADTETYPVDETVPIIGNGYGHGHGMSQWGAQGAAEEGLGAMDIVKFYYPGTTRGSDTGFVRVLISGDTSPDVVVSPRSALKVVDLATRQALTLPDNGARRWRLDVASNGQTGVSFLTDTWRRWRLLTGDGQFSAGGAPIELWVAGESTAYRGALRLARVSSTSKDRDTVNVLKLDNYVRGVVPKEVYTTWLPAALRAQAIAARTYAARERNDAPAGRHYQICDTTRCQVYGGYSAEVASTNDAVKATEGVILTWEGEPAFTQFSASSGGWTTAGSQPYLVAQEDLYDLADANPYRPWSASFTAAKLAKLWGLGDLEQITVLERDGNGEWGGRVLSLRLEGTTRDVTLSGDDLRIKLGLRSTYFTFDLP